MYTYKKIGKIEPVKSCDISESPLGIGLEKLDRDVFDPTDCYDYLAESGVKWIRIQSGWAKTEKTKGKYDFDWLDSIVDNLLSRGLTPWICLCYGNQLYDERANGLAGGIGCPPIHDSIMKQGWANYCAAIAEHYAGRVSHFEVWNEPDGKWCWRHGVNGREYGEFARDTSIAIRSKNPAAKIFGGAFCGHNIAWLDQALKSMAGYIDAITYHDYGINPEYNGFGTEHNSEYRTFVKLVRSLVDMYNPAIELIQGETGCHSEFSSKGAVDNCNWTPEKQAKLLLRRMLLDVLSGVKFSSYFSTADMYENLNGPEKSGKHEEYGFYGVLGEAFENGTGTGKHYPKPSYYAMQTLAALMGNGVRVCNLPIEFRQNNNLRWQQEERPDDARIRSGSFILAHGRKAFVYWMATDILTQTFDSIITLKAVNMLKIPKLVDLRDGTVYEIPEEKIDWIDENNFTITSLRITDYPQMLIFE